VYVDRRAHPSASLRSCLLARLVVAIELGEIRHKKTIASEIKTVILIQGEIRKKNSFIEPDKIWIQLEVI
jgi:hypothetical protein